VVTSEAGGEPIGTTVNSFTSVSLQPPLVLFCLHKQSRLNRGLAESGAFVVNFLAGRQERLARSFANRQTAAVPDGAHYPSATGMPILRESLAFLACRLSDEFAGGDHTIVLGEVVELGSPRLGHEPLIFFRGRLSPLEDRLWTTHPIVDG
jgi:flavin reductase (DIM6/NTAB) family NADH-FMN oxidoreductase RutF